METQKGKLRLEKPQMTEEITNAIKDLAAGGVKEWELLQFLDLFHTRLLLLYSAWKYDKECKS